MHTHNAQIMMKFLMSKSLPLVLLPALATASAATNTLFATIIWRP
jgi:hypothetical protein